MREGAIGASKSSSFSDRYGPSVFTCIVNEGCILNVYWCTFPNTAYSASFLSWYTFSKASVFDFNSRVFKDSDEASELVSSIHYSQVWDWGSQRKISSTELPSLEPDSVAAKVVKIEVFNNNWVSSLLVKSHNSSKWVKVNVSESQAFKNDRYRLFCQEGTKSD